MANDAAPNSVKGRRLHKRLALLVGGLLIAYLAIAYVVLPSIWKGYERRHPSLDDVSGITQTADGIPGDPLNVAMVGTEEELIAIMHNAKWYKAAALGLESDLKIAVDTVLSRPDDNAPVSSLYLFGRKEDLAFEQPVGDNPRQRHHVRFWKSDKRRNDRPVWVGSAIYDQHVGFSRDTGQITHVTAPDVDTERDYLFKNLEATQGLAQISVVYDFHKVREGRNGGGDPWHTDGRLLVGVIAGKP
jgi:LssY C-terminus